MIREKSNENILDYLKNLDKEATSNKVELTKAAFVKKPVTPVLPTEGVVDSTCGSEASTIEVGNRTLILTTPVGQSAGELKMEHLFTNSNSEVHTNQHETSVSSTPDLKTKHNTHSPVPLIRPSSDSLFNPVVKLDSNSPQPGSNSSQCGQEPAGTESKLSVETTLASKKDELSPPHSNAKKGCCDCFSRLMQCCGLFRKNNQKIIPSKETIHLAGRPNDLGK